jgi:hypothetical protein
VGRPNAAKALPAIRFRFGDAEDITKYGDRWFIFNEGAILRRPARDLIQIENELGLPLVNAFNGFRASTTLGDMCAAWIAVRDVDVKLAGSFDDFNPIIMMIEWEEAPTEGKDETETPATPEPEDSTSRTGDPSPESISETTPSVVLPVMPVVESENS